MLASDFWAIKVFMGQGWEKSCKNLYFSNFKITKLKILIHTLMIVIRIGSLRVRLAYVYDLYMYDSPTVMNDTCMQIVPVDFLRVRQSYAYDMKTHVFLPILPMGMLIICFKFTSTCQSYAKIDHRGLSVRLACAYDSSSYNCSARWIYKRMIIVRMGSLSNFYICVTCATHMHRNCTSTPIIRIRLLPARQ